jgi:hypothetical protein
MKSNLRAVLAAAEAGTLDSTLTCAYTLSDGEDVTEIVDDNYELLNLDDDPITLTPAGETELEHLRRYGAILPARR